MNAEQRALYYLDIQPRTEAQLRAYLEKKGYNESETDQTIEKLKTYHYIDDFEYSVQYFRYGFDKGRGLSRIRGELLEKGVESEVIDAAYAELDYVPDQFESALSICQGMVDGIDVSGLSYDERGKLAAKIRGKLITRGFSPEITYEVINELLKQ